MIPGISLVAAPELEDWVPAIETAIKSALQRSGAQRFALDQRKFLDSIGPGLCRRFSCPSLHFSSGPTYPALKCLRSLLWTISGQLQSTRAALLHFLLEYVIGGFA
jgi:hypothetical protein